jgi:hypothetical protein
MDGELVASGSLFTLVFNPWSRQNFSMKQSEGGNWQLLFLNPKPTPDLTLVYSISEIWKKSIVGR